MNRKKMNDALLNDRLDEAVSLAFKELSTIESLVFKLRLTLGHLEELAKKNRDELIETQKEEEKEYEGV
jgi:hypothetical protein|tara:strand:- start:557 stop:763 length:207 start_codon:yes stop_codon:yes gene_type:complete